MTDTGNKLLVLSGPPRCGKSTWAHNRVEQRPGCAIVNCDAVRRALYQRRFWMPCEKLIHPYAWIMVRALFIAGHREVIIDETNLTLESIGEWRCNATGTTPSTGGRHYQSLLAVDKSRDEVASNLQDTMDSAEFETWVANELQGDVIAWKRHVVIFRTPFDVCEQRIAQLKNYNQRTSLLNYFHYIRFVLKWNPNFVENLHLDKDGETYEFVDYQ